MEHPEGEGQLHKATARVPNWREGGPCRPRRRDKAADRDPGQAVAGRNQGIGRIGVDLGLVHLDTEMGTGGVGLDWRLVRLDIEMGRVVWQQQSHALEAVGSRASGDRSWCCLNYPFYLYSRTSVSLFIC